jgi:hypothetical protein
VRFVGFQQHLLSAHRPSQDDRAGEEMTGLSTEQVCNFGLPIDTGQPPATILTAFPWHRPRSLSLRFFSGHALERRSSPFSSEPRLSSSLFLFVVFVISRLENL